jgi:hypothetical protein
MTNALGVEDGVIATSYGIYEKENERRGVGDFPIIESFVSSPRIILFVHITTGGSL